MASGRQRGEYDPEQYWEDLYNDCRPPDTSSDEESADGDDVEARDLAMLEMMERLDRDEIEHYANMALHMEGA